jgi:hypothetical protein
MDASKALWKATEDALNSSVKSTMQTLTWQMNKSIEMVPNNFGIKKFAVAFNGLLGQGSETVSNLIYTNSCKHLKVKTSLDPSRLALDKINKILKTKKMRRCVTRTRSILHGSAEILS